MHILGFHQSESSVIKVNAHSVTQGVSSGKVGLTGLDVPYAQLQSKPHRVIGSSGPCAFLQSAVAYSKPTSTHNRNRNLEPKIH